MPFFFPRRHRHYKLTLWLMVVELPITVVILTLTGIASHNTYRTLLWQDGADNGFNSAPNAALYAAANYRPYTAPMVWSSLYVFPGSHQGSNRMRLTCRSQYDQLQSRHRSHQRLLIDRQIPRSLHAPVLPSPRSFYPRCHPGAIHCFGSISGWQRHVRSEASPTRPSLVYHEELQRCSPQVKYRILRTSKGAVCRLCRPDVWSTPLTILSSLLC